MKRGRLKIEAGVDETRLARFLVVPEDGGEPIELPVTGAVASAESGNYVRVSLEVAPAQLDVAGVEDGNEEATVAIVGGPRAHEVDVTRDGEPVRCLDVRWQLGELPQGRNRVMVGRELGR